MRKQPRSGRKPMPTERKVIEGKFRPDRHTVPVVSGGHFPDMPSGLSEVEQQLWAELPRPCWIVESDVLTLKALVAIYAKILEVRAKNAEKWRLTFVAQESQLWGRLLTILSTLGMTPADRSKVAPTRPQVKATDEPWAGII